MNKLCYHIPYCVNTPSFWVNHLTDGKEVLLSQKDINNFNEAIKSKIPSLNFLSTDKTTLKGKAITQHIQTYLLPNKNAFDYDGQLINDDFYEEILINRNLENISDIVPIKYGITLCKSSLRAFPTENAVYYSIKHSKLNNFDRFQETSCFPFESLIILHKSLDKKWYFVKTYNYMGWIKAQNIAICDDKEELFNYINSKDFLIVTGKEITLNIIKDINTPVKIKCGMGTKLCKLESSKTLDYYVVKIPTVQSNGKMVFQTTYINKKDDVTVGYLPYTRENIITQAFKLLNTDYDWGDKFNGKDCSSFIMTVYRCFGFLLPRNANEQEKSFVNINNSIVFSPQDTLEHRYNYMNSLKTGAALFKPGHVMMYLGKYDEIHYMIHSFSEYGIKNHSSLEQKLALGIAVSPVDLLTSSGETFLETFTSAVYFQ